MENQKIIYVAEDNPALIALMKAVLGRRGEYRVSFYNDGLELYQKVLEEPPEMLVLDIILPGISGLAIARLLKFHEDYRHIPILISSSITDADIKERALATGADSFLPKPFTPGDLLHEIASLVK